MPKEETELFLKRANDIKTFNLKFKLKHKN